MFFKVVATFLKIVLFYLKRYCIWLNDALYVAGTFCATCFFLPEVLYLVRYEMGLWIKECIFTCWKKHSLIEILRYIFKRSGFLQRNATYWKGILFCLREATPFEWKCLFVKPALVNWNWFFKRRMHVWSSLPFSGLGKRPKVDFFFKCGLNHYLRETLQRGGGTRRHVNYT